MDSIGLGLDPSGNSQGMTGPVPYSDVDDIKSTLQALFDAGTTARQDPTYVGGGMLRASVTDADGNVIGLVQAP